MEQAGLGMVERVINHEMKERFGADRATGRAAAAGTTGDRAGAAAGAGVRRGGGRRGPGRVAAGPPGRDRGAPAGAVAAAALGAAARVHLRLSRRPPAAPRIERAGRRVAGRRAAVRARDRDQGDGAAAGQLRVPGPGRAGRGRDRGAGWRPASTTAWTRSRSPTGSPVTCRTSPGTSTCALRLGGGPGPAGREPGRTRIRDHEAAAPCARWGGWTTSASAGSSGWTATSATSTCAGWPCRPTRARPSPRPWSWWPGPTRSSSTCGTTAAARRRAWSSGAATCSTASRPTSTTSSAPTPARPGSSGRCPTCPGPATRTSRSTC